MRHTRTHLWIPFLAVAAFAVGGCGLGAAGQTGPKTIYLIETHRPGPPVQQPIPGVLQVQDFVAAPSASGSELLYRKGVSVEKDYYRELLSTPGSTVGNLARQWLQRGHVFGVVVPADMAVDPSFILEGNLTELYGDFTEPAAPKAVMSIQFVLVRGTRLSDAAFHREYTSTQPLKAATGDALIEGYNRALADILTRLETDLLATRAQLVSPPPAAAATQGTNR